MIKVLFFAHLREAAGSESIELEISRKTVSELKETISKMYGLNLDAVMVAVNEEFADNETEIFAGDTIAFIPPVSGG